MKICFNKTLPLGHRLIVTNINKQLHNSQARCAAFPPKIWKQNTSFVYKTEMLSILGQNQTCTSRSAKDYHQTTYILVQYNIKLLYGFKYTFMLLYFYSLQMKIREYIKQERRTRMYLTELKKYIAGLILCDFFNTTIVSTMNHQKTAYIKIPVKMTKVMSVRKC